MDKIEGFYFFTYYKAHDKNCLNAVRNFESAWGFDVSNGLTWKVVEVLVLT